MQARAASPRRGPSPGESLRRGKGMVPGNAHSRPLRAPSAPSRAAPSSRTLSSPAPKAALPSRQREAGPPCHTSPSRTSHSHSFPIAPVHGTASAVSVGTIGPHRQRGGRGSHVAQSLPLAVVGELVAIAAAGGTAATSGVIPAHLGHLTISAAAVTQLSLTAVAVAYGAYLSDGLLRQQGQAAQPEPLVYHGVDVTEYEIFRTPEVQRAVEYAAMAHRGQKRRTGDPYVTHCIHTARIAAALAPGTSKRAVETVVAAVLHDVVDDTGHTLGDVEAAFGGEVARLVDGVSRLSYINQLLRRHRRTAAEQQDRENTGLSPEDVDSLRLMLIGMINDPRVVLVKLADRLHNMRTIYALPEAKARAVAQETLSIWCSLASRLGVWAIKAELEDLCFAILQPHIFRKIRGELAAMWSSPEDWRSFRRRTRLRRYTTTRGAPPAQGEGAPAGSLAAAATGAAVVDGVERGSESGQSTVSPPLSPLTSSPPSSPSSASSSQPLLTAASAAAAELIRDFSPFRTSLSSPTFSTFSPLSPASASSSSDDEEGWRGGESTRGGGGQGGASGASPQPRAAERYTVQDLVESVIPFHVLLNKTYRHTGSLWPSQDSPREGSHGEPLSPESAQSLERTPAGAYSPEGTLSIEDARNLEAGKSSPDLGDATGSGAAGGALSGFEAGAPRLQAGETALADQAVLRAVHNLPTLPQLAQRSADSRGPGAAGAPRAYPGMQADSGSEEDGGLEGPVRDGAVRGGAGRAGEARGHRALTRVMVDAEVALGALRKCEEQLQRELLLTTPYVPGMEVSLSGRLKSIYSCHAKMRRKGVGLEQIYDARALRVVVGDGGGRFQEAAVEACYNLLSVVHRLWTPIGGEFDDYILNPKPSGYQSLHTAVVGPDGAPLEVQIRTQMMHESAEFGHAAHWLYKESDMPPEAPASAASDAHSPAPSEPAAGALTTRSAVGSGRNDSLSAQSVAAANASAPDALGEDPNPAVGHYQAVLEGDTAAGAVGSSAAEQPGGVGEGSLYMPTAKELQRTEATSEGEQGPRAEAGGAQGQDDSGYSDRGATMALQKSEDSDNRRSSDGSLTDRAAWGEEAGKSLGSAGGVPGAPAEEGLSGSVRTDPYGLPWRRLQPLSGNEGSVKEGSPMKGPRTRGSGDEPPQGGAAEARGDPEAAGGEEASSPSAGKLPGGQGWGYRGAAAPPWEDEYGSEAEDGGGPAVYPGGSRPIRPLLQFPVPGGGGKLVMEGHPALRVAEGRLLSSVVIKVEAGGSSLLVAVSFALRAREAVARGMRGASAQGGGGQGSAEGARQGGGAGTPGARWERWEGYARLFDKVDGTWWNAPGHGDWSTCLEQYELCSDGIYHKVDRFGRVLPTFIQLLDLSPSDVRDYQAIMDAVRGGGALLPQADDPPDTPTGERTPLAGNASMPGGDSLVGATPSGSAVEGDAWGGGSAQGASAARQQAGRGEGVGSRSEVRGGGRAGTRGDRSEGGVPTVEGDVRSSSVGRGELGQQPERGRGGGEEGDALNLTARINNKVRLLRSMLQWERELRHEAAPDGTVSSLEGEEGAEAEAQGMEGLGTAAALTEVLVVRWPGGDIVRLPGGSCAEVFVRREEERRGAGKGAGDTSAAGAGGDAGAPAPVVLVNGRPADLRTPLQDGDLVEIRQKVEARAQEEARA